MVSKTRNELTEIQQGVDNAREAIRLTMGVGFSRLEEYGQLAIEAVAGMRPPGAEGRSAREDLSEFFRLLIRRGIDQGHFRPGLDVEYAVGAWFDARGAQHLERADARSVHRRDRCGDG